MTLWSNAGRKIQKRGQPLNTYSPSWRTTSQQRNPSTSPGKTCSFPRQLEHSLANNKLYFWPYCQPVPKASDAGIWALSDSRLNLEGTRQVWDQLAHFQLTEHPIRFGLMTAFLFAVINILYFQMQSTAQWLHHGDWCGGGCDRNIIEQCWAPDTGFLDLLDRVSRQNPEHSHCLWFVPIYLACRSQMHCTMRTDPLCLFNNVA